jgi:nucleoid-associated protein YgaU
MTSDPNQDPVQAMLAQTSLKTSLFAPNSRYYGIGTATLDVPGGDPVAYVLRRFVPRPERLQTLQTYTVQQGDRLDNIAAKFLGDPTLFWRLCDANRAMRPWDLTETPGTRLRVTMPDGVTGTAL